VDTTFASSSVPRHLVRGAVGLVLIVAALALVRVWGPVALLLLLPAGVALRGCPTCWALGLVQTRALGRASACPAPLARAAGTAPPAATPAPPAGSTAVAGRLARPRTSAGC
jgi:hypothetical protein